MTRIDAAARFFVDQMGTVAAPKNDTEIVIPASGSLGVVGWAAELGGEPVSGVNIIIDQKSYPATYGVERADVAAALKNPGFSKSGFMLNMPASQLSSGAHTLTIRIINSARNAYVETPTFHIRVQ
jgi:hypothetical protein